MSKGVLMVVSKRCFEFCLGGQKNQWTENTWTFFWRPLWDNRPRDEPPPVPGTNGAKWRFYCGIEQKMASLSQGRVPICPGEGSRLSQGQFSFVPDTVPRKLFMFIGFFLARSSGDWIPPPPFNLNLTSFLPQFYLMLTSFLPLFNLNLTSASSGISNHGLETTVYIPLECSLWSRSTEITQNTPCVTCSGAVSYAQVSSHQTIYSGCKFTVTRGESCPENFACNSSCSFPEWQSRVLQYTTRAPWEPFWPISKELEWGQWLSCPAVRGLLLPPPR